MFFHSGSRFCYSTFKRYLNFPFSVTRSFSSDKARDFKSTFQFMILEKFRTENEYVSFSKNTSVNFYPNGVDPKKYQTQDYLQFLVKNKSSAIKSSRVKEVMFEISKRTQSANLTEILVIFDASLVLFGHKFINSEIHSRGLNRINDILNLNVYSVQLYLQSLFYASIFKHSSHYNNLIKRILLLLTPNIRKLSLIELGIFCNSLFRSSIKLNDCCTSYIVNSLKQNLDLFIKDSYVFTSVIKCLRYANYYNEDLFKLLSCNIDNFRDITLVAKIHLFVYLSDQKYSNTDFIFNLMKIIMADIINSETSIRLKDVDNILWALANYTFPNAYETFNLCKLTDIIKKEMDLHSNNAHTIFACLLYLWIINSKKDKSIFNYITRENVNKVTKMKNFKEAAKVSLLLTCVSIEAPEILESSLPEERDFRLTPKIDKYLTKRPQLKKLYNILKNNDKVLNISDLRYEFVIPSLYIYGLKANVGSSHINIELLDETVCLRGVAVPHGQMALKLRLVQKLNLKTFVVKNVNTLNNQEDLLNDLKTWLSS